MRRHSEFHLILGGLIWIGLLSFLFLLCRQGVKTTDASPVSLVRYLTRQNTPIELQFDVAQPVRIGDPIFCDVDGRPKIIGRVVRVNEPDSIDPRLVYADKVYVELYPTAPTIGADASFTYHATPASFAWVAATMLSDDTQQQISKLILIAYQNHQAEIVSALRPIVEDSIRNASQVIREDLEKAFRNHEPEIQRIGSKFQKDLIDKEIVPLVKEEIWPIIQKRGQPLTEEIGAALWDEVSVWRFGWRALYDAVPMTEQNLTSREFKRFLERKAMPIIEERTAAIIDVQQKVLSDISKNETVKQVVSSSMRKVLDDPEVQDVLTKVFQEVFVGNTRLKAVLESHWNSLEAQRALDVTNRRLEPTITKIGQLLFGSLDEKISDDFSRVLRSRIMNKDNRWFYVKRGPQLPGEKPTEAPAKPFNVKISSTWTENPFESAFAPRKTNSKSEQTAPQDRLEGQQ